MMRESRKPILSALPALAALGAGMHPACAQDATGPGGMQIFVNSLPLARRRLRHHPDAAGARARGQFERRPV